MPGAENPDVLLTTRRLACFEATAEREKTLLSRTLHDDLGGLLVAAAMDTAWAEQHLADGVAVRERLHRVRSGIAAAIALKRNLIERLRPTLLENIGLIAALRWYHQQNCNLAKLKCIGAYPAEELDLSSSASIVLFRIVEEALSFATRQPAVQAVYLLLNIAAGAFCIRVTHDGEVVEERRRKEVDMVSIWLIEHRLRALGGEASIAHPATGGMVLDVSVPLSAIVNGS
jgi:two-component system, NarL family, sensor histidine kinase UhpB